MDFICIDMAGGRVDSLVNLAARRVICVYGPAKLVHFLPFFKQVKIIISWPKVAE